MSHRFELMRRVVGTGCVAFGIVILALVQGWTSVYAETPPQDPPPGDSAEAAASVRMKERCIWYVAGIPGIINLLPAGDDIGRLYDGTEYSLAVNLPDLMAWNSGNETGGGVDDPDEHAWCTYFGTTSGIQVLGQWSEGGFVAATSEGKPDLGLNFDLSESNPLGVAISGGDCRTPGQVESRWLVGDNVGKTSNVGTVSVPLLAQPLGETTDTPANGEQENDRCNISWVVSINIPAGGTPRYAGETYIFTGPTFTTEISLDYVE
jgi:hypothetical protein